MILKQGRLLVAIVTGLVVFYLLANNQNLSSYRKNILSYAPVDKTVVAVTETDQGRNFVKVTTVDGGSGSQKNVFTRTGLSSKSAEGTLLVVSLIANVNSFGKGRGFGDFMDVIGSLDYDKSKVNLAFFCGTTELFDQADAFVENFLQTGAQYGKITLLRADFLKSDFASSEHNDNVQRQRRRLIARARNYAVISSLDSEQYTIFMDADIVKFDQKDMVRRFVASEKDIVVPRIESGPNNDYDRNSWRGERISPPQNQQKLMDENRWSEVTFVPRDKAKAMFHLGDHVRDVKDSAPEDPKLNLDYVTPLDSVGGAVLFAKSIIYKQGVVFPPYYIVGTTWGRHEGFDGIETEGLCYIARLVGYLCWGMPNLVAQHTDNSWI